jgi:hypothetical protein
MLYTLAVMVRVPTLYEFLEAHATAGTVSIKVRVASVMRRITLDRVNIRVA